MSEVCSVCGYALGDRVRMPSGFVRQDGSPTGDVHGVVETWSHGCHIAVWEETGAVTALPNPNIRRDA